MSAAQVNGIVMREDFKTAVKIFNNAFNPKFTSPGVLNQKYDPNWDAISAFKLTQSELRLEQPFVINNATYLFPVLSNIQNQAQQFPSEVRLNLQDSFVPTRLGVYVAKPSSATDSTFLMYTSFNPTVFLSGVAMNTFYNGQLNLTINNQIYINNWGILRHKCVNQTQQTVTPLVATDLQEQFDGSVDGMYPINPFVLLLGSQNIQLKIQLPAALTAVDANSRVILRFEGILAQNSTVVN